MIKVDLKALEREKAAVRAFHKKQVEAFVEIKKEAEKAQWADDKFDEFVQCMNSISSTLAATLQTLSNGRDVYMIDELTLAAEEYLEFERRFPII